jgi:hypothetical protein
MEIDLEYFELRAEEERRAARRATEQCSRERHLEIAKRYQDLRDALKEQKVGEHA